MTIGTGAPRAPMLVKHLILIFYIDLQIHLFDVERSFRKHVNPHLELA
jgi:hypothetical protein